MAEYDEDTARKYLSRLVGTLVQYPEKFLRRENLSPTITTKVG